MSLALALVLTAGSLAQDLPMRSRCTFESEGLRVVLDGLTACGDDMDEIEAAEEALERHRDLHGWGWRDGFDLVSADRQVKCRAEDLELLRSMMIPCGESSSSSLHRAIAQCLERNGRVDDALELLDGDLEAALSRADPARFMDSNQPAYFAEDGARYAARHGRWGEAFRFAEHWTSTSWCGNCADSQNDRILRFRATCLIELGRLDEARGLCIEKLESEWSPGVMTEEWIETFVREESPVDARAATKFLADLASPRLQDDLAYGVRCWSARRLPAREQLSHLEELCYDHEEDLVPLLLSLPEPEFEKLAAPLLDEEVTDADLRVASLLAQTGRSALQPALDKLVSLAGDRVKWTYETWSAVRERRVRLSQP